MQVAPEVIFKDVERTAWVEDFVAEHDDHHLATIWKVTQP